MVGKKNQDLPRWCEPPRGLRPEPEAVFEFQRRGKSETFFVLPLGASDAHIIPWGKSLSCHAPEPGLFWNLTWQSEAGSARRGKPPLVEADG